VIDRLVTALIWIAGFIITALISQTAAGRSMSDFLARWLGAKLFFNFILGKGPSSFFRIVFASVLYGTVFGLVSGLGLLVLSSINSK
jgi:hypothetical protein